MSVSAIIVTRGNVPIQWDVPLEWERVLWDNGAGVCRVWHPESKPWDAVEHLVSDLSVFGRYAAIEYASNDLIYVVDDDVIVSDPQAIVQRWIDQLTITRASLSDEDAYVAGLGTTCLVANMPQEFRHDGYTDSCLVGFGACFHRDLPERAFERYYEAYVNHLLPRGSFNGMWKGEEVFNRTCDVVFTTLTPRLLVDVPKTDREFASDPDRMWKQPQHYGERVRMLDLARQVRDA